MWRVQGGHRSHDSAHTALVIAGIAVALGGAALFGIVAHTRIPLRMTGTAPPDLPRQFAVEPRPAATQLALAEIPAPLPVDASPASDTSPLVLDSLSKGESVVLLPKPPSRLV